MAVYGTIICLGDSLTHGARDGYGRCYPFELSDMLWEEFGQRWICADEGVNGDTSTDVLRRSITVMKKYPEAKEVVLLCGTNDSKSTVNMPPHIYKKNMDGIIRVCAVHEKDVLLCKIPDLRGFGAPDYDQMSAIKIDSFNEILEEVAGENVDTIRSVIDLTGIPKEYYADGVHFKNIGYVEIARRILKGIQRKRHFQTPTVYSDADGSYRDKPNTNYPRDPKLTTYFGETKKKIKPNFETNFDVNCGKGGL